MLSFEVCMVLSIPLSQVCFLYIIHTQFVWTCWHMIVKCEEYKNNYQQPVLHEKYSHLSHLFIMYVTIYRYIKQIYVVQFLFCYTIYIHIIHANKEITSEHLYAQVKIEISLFSFKMLLVYPPLPSQMFGSFLNTLAL